MVTKIIRRIDDLGRIVIPREIRRSIRVKEYDMFEISCDGEKIILTKVKG